MTRDVESEADRLLAAVDALSSTQDAVRRSVEVRADLTPTQLHVLIAVLRAPEGISEQDIARGIDVPVRPVQAVVDALAARRFVSIVPSPRGAGESIVHGAVDIHEEPWSDLVELEQRIDAAVSAQSRDAVEAAASVIERVASSVHDERQDHAEGVS